MKRLLLTLILANLFALFTFGQNIKISGKVTDKATGETLPGVNIVIKGTSVGTTTDIDGKYNIEAPQNSTLRVSFIGYSSKGIAVKSRSKIDITLELSSEQLDEIIVVGYGQMRKSDLTGSVASVSVKNANESGASSVNQLLQGRASGVYVKTNSGIPGGTVSINIRGVSSMSASSQPLYVIDGIIIDGTNGDITGDDITESNPLSFLSPDDIQSIEVLKDASATAIYGSRGANGVVLITTKKGVSGKPKITYSGNVSFSRIAKKIDIMDGPTYARYRNAFDVINEADNLSYDGRDEDHPLPEDVGWIDWQDEIYQTAVTNKHRVSISGGEDKSSFFASMGYMNADGIISSTGFEKIDFRVNYTKQFSDRISFSTNINGAHIDNNMTVGTDFFGGDKSMVGSILNTRPIVNDFFDEDGLFEDELMDINSPYKWLNAHTDNTKEITFNSKFNLDIKITDYLNFTTRVGVNYRSKERKRYFGRDLFKGEQSDGVAQLYNWDNLHYVVDNLLFFKKKINKHRINGTLGLTYDNKTNVYNRYESSFFIDDFTGASAMQAGAVQQITSNRTTPVTFASGLFRLNYNYGSKYSITTTGRVDGSSKFAPGNQWGFFSSMAAAYRLSQEDFIKDIDFISNLKIRVGWGQVGSSSSPAYATLNQFSYALGSDATGATVMTLRPSSKGNPDLTWETAQQTNVGVDMGFFSDRLTMTIDAYYKTTIDQLQNIALPSSSGYESMWINLGKVENKGIEMQFNAVVVSKADFRIDLGGNIAFNRNKILEIGRLPDIFDRVYYTGKNLGGNDEIKAPVNVFMEGQPVGAFWGLHTDGITQDAEDAANSPTFYGISIPEGNIKFVDIRGDNDDPDDDIEFGAPDGNINGLDYDIIGDPNPDFTYGINGAIKYKDLSLEFLFTGVQGRELFNANRARLWNHLRSSSNKTVDSFEEAWTPEVPSNEFPRLDFEESTFSSVFTDRWIEDASYFKLNHLTISYMLKTPNSKTIRNIKVYATGTNLFTITQYSGYDPEADSFSWDPMRTGVDLNSYPSIRALLLGVNLNF